jgi:hypothetical protein
MFYFILNPCSNSCAPKFTQVHFLAFLKSLQFSRNFLEFFPINSSTKIFLKSFLNLENLFLGLLFIHGFRPNPPAAWALAFGRSAPHLPSLGQTSPSFQAHYPSSSSLGSPPSPRPTTPPSPLGLGLHPAQPTSTLSSHCHVGLAQLSSSSG